MFELGIDRQCATTGKRDITRGVDNSIMILVATRCTVGQRILAAARRFDDRKVRLLNGDCSTVGVANSRAI